MADCVYTLRMKRYGFSRHVLVAGGSSCLLRAKWFPGLGFLGRKYLFCGTSDTHRLWLEQKLFGWHFMISENGRIIGEVETNTAWTRGLVKIQDLCEFEIFFGHGLRTSFSTITNNGEHIKISYTKWGGGWEVLLPSNLDDYRVLGGLALVYAAFMSRA